MSHYICAHPVVVWLLQTICSFVFHRYHKVLLAQQDHLRTCFKLSWWPPFNLCLLLFVIRLVDWFKHYSVSLRSSKPVWTPCSSELKYRITELFWVKSSFKTCSVLLWSIISLLTHIGFRWLWKLLCIPNWRVFRSCTASTFSQEPAAHWHFTGFASNAAVRAAPKQRQQPVLAMIIWSKCTKV